MKVPSTMILKKVGFVAAISLATAFLVNYLATKSRVASKVQQAVATGDIKRLTA